MDSMKSNFEKKVKPILLYVGTIGAVLMAIAYIAIVLIMIFGFQAATSLSQTLIFAGVNAIIGLVIMQLLKIQGIDLAKSLDTNKPILDQYYNTKTKDKKNHSLKYFWLTTITKDVVVKALSIAVTTVGMIYIVIQGTGNTSLLLLALVNLIMFSCFGLLSLVKAYDFFNEEYIPFVQEKINEADEERIKQAQEEERARQEALEREVQRRVDLAKKEFNKQRNDLVYSDRGSDILESSVDNSSSCTDSRSLVLDGDNRDNCVLGGAVHTSDCASNSVHIPIEEDTQENKNTEEQ